MAATNVQAFSGDVEISSNLVVNTNDLFVDTVSGRIGIGRTDPGKELSVMGNMELGKFANDYHHLRLGGGNSSGFLYGAFSKYGDGIHMGYNFYNDNTDNQIPVTNGATSRISMGYGQIRLHTGGVNTEPNNDALCISSDGKVGIGKANPGEELDVVGTIKASTDMDTPLISNSGGQFKMGSAYNYSSQVRAGGSIQMRIDDVEIARFQNSALGIGTNSPSSNSRLSIYRAFAYPGHGNQTADDARSSITWMSNLSTSGQPPAPLYTLSVSDVASIFFQPRTYQYVGSPHAGHHGVLHMSAGNSSQSVPTTNSNFSLSSTNGLGLGTADPVSYSLDCYSRTYRTRNSQGHWRFGIGGTEFFVYAEGTSPANRGVYIAFNGTSWTGNSSDIRTKKNLTPINDALQKIRNVRPRLFHYKEDKDTDRKTLGFIAQDWLEQQPECVYHNETQGVLTMSVTETVPVICAAVQELDTKQQAIEEVVNNLSDFTGQHRCLMKDISPNDYAKYEGLIVSANNNEYLNHDSITKPTINEALPIVSLTNKEKDKTCLGVISLKADPESHLPDDPTRLKINALGEGAVWVTDINGPLQSGDYITSSNIVGYGMRQDDDVIHNYTIAKITQDCDFTKKMRKVKKLVKELKDITYYKFTNKVDITKDEYDVTDESLRLEEDYEYYSRKEIRHIKDDTPGLFDSDAYQRIDDVQSVSKEEYDKNQSLYDKKTVYKMKDSGEIAYIDEELYNLDPSKYVIEVTYTTKTIHLSKEEYDRNPTLYDVIKVKIKEHKCDKDKFAALKDEDGLKHEFKLAMSKKYYKLDKIETKEPHPGYETEVRKELVNVLDENGQLTWIESEETETEYDLRYLTSNGSQTDEANAIHRAAFVGCTYHCG